MKTSLALAVLLALAAGTSAHAQTKVYTWVDSSGVRHHADRPPPGQANLQPRKVDVVVPPPSHTVKPIAALDGAGQPRLDGEVPPATQAEAKEKLRASRVEDCEVARNNLRLLSDPKAKIVEKGAEASGKAMSDADRINAYVVAERQVQEFCQPFPDS